MLNRNIIPLPTTSSSNDEEVCPKCHGTGWELYETEDGTEEIYGQPLMVSYARKCTCNSRALQNEDRTEFPSNLRDANMAKFDWSAYSVDTSDLKRVCRSFYDDFLKWKSAGKGLYVWSKTSGSGKTFISACMAKGLMFRTGCLVKYVTPVDYINKVALGYKNNKNGNFNDPSKVYRECSLLVLDDIGTQKKDEWYEQELFRLIDERSSNNLSTIFTSNYRIEELNVDERVKSRIMKASITIHMPEESIRNKKAVEEQSDFITKMLNGGAEDEATAES